MKTGRTSTRGARARRSGASSGSGTDFEIRKLAPSNFGHFVGLIERLAEYERLEPPDAAARRRLRRDGLGPSPRFDAHVGYLCGEPVAYTIHFLTYSSFLALPTLYLEDLFVVEEARKLGVGRRMFEFCRRRAKELGCGRMEWAVLDWNEPAMRFYRKLGGSKLPWFLYRLDPRA